MKILRFFWSYTIWLLNGRRFRRQEYIDKLYDICDSCPLFEKFAPDADFGECGICGCNINKERKTLNKLAWDSTSCPDNPPRWTGNNWIRSAWNRLTSWFSR